MIYSSCLFEIWILKSDDNSTIKTQQSHPNSDCQDSEQVAFLPSGLELPGTDATTASFCLPEQAESDTIQGSRSFWT